MKDAWVYAAFAVAIVFGFLIGEYAPFFADAVTMGVCQPWSFCRTITGLKYAFGSVVLVALAITTYPSKVKR